ncbi:MAG: beta-lysine N6-acetyltransferase [Candidatus Methanomethylophilaceae archaeon]|nr:beta-lysine N6-acetyltransferase [Candidatus Methanomethylophilaceae archaeon]MDI3542244.1 beta-lysine N6-acetyltransferase [Candidatus Methanomethylophilaceae archaeon]
MPDTTMRLGRSLVHHGPLNDRVYLMKLDPKDMPVMPCTLLFLARRNGRGKVIAKVPEAYRKDFLSYGYEVEAVVKGMMGGEDGYFMSFFLDQSRRGGLELKEQQILHKAQSSEKRIKSTHEVSELSGNDAREMALLMNKVFPSYPFPMSNPDYILHCMSGNVVYYGIKEKGKLVAMGAAEMDENNLCVEMTDLATHPIYRGMGMSSSLLIHMEGEMRKRGYRVAFTIARSASTGMNIVFSRGGYNYGGTLSRNTNIFGNLENMNIWYKSL